MPAPARVAHEEAQQFELGGGELDRGAGAGDLVRVLVEGEVADGEHRVLGLGERQGGAADEPAQARDDLFEAERLGDVVVAAGGETGDAVVERVLAR